MVTITITTDLHILKRCLLWYVDYISIKLLVEVTHRGTWPLYLPLDTDMGVMPGAAATILQSCASLAIALMCWVIRRKIKTVSYLLMLLSCYVNKSWRTLPLDCLLYKKNSLLFRPAGMTSRWESLNHYKSVLCSQPWRWVRMGNRTEVSLDWNSVYRASIVPPGTFSSSWPPTHHCKSADNNSIYHPYPQTV